MDEQKQPIAFETLDLPEALARAVEDLGFTEATEIQGRSIPVIREGRDVIGRSQTGTGKTIAFGLPALERIDPHGPHKQVQVLILCPTRELAMQASDEMEKLSKYSQGVNIATVYGGAPMDRQIAKLRRANIVIGTPGRVMDHLRRKTMRLHALKMIVLDEADEMLSMGFRDDIETILQDAPEDRQTVLFSATMPPAIMKLTQEFQNDPVVVAVNVKQVTLDHIKQYFYQVPAGAKKPALQVLLQYHQPKRVIIFVNTKRMADEITVELNHSGHSAEGLHGDMKQPQRTKVMEQFKDGRIGILVATDVAARGIDVSGVDFVINYDIPQNGEYYVHRIGRTGRAGNSGTAITLCCGRRQVQELLQLGRLAKSRPEELPLPQSEDITAAQQQSHRGKVEEILLEGAESYLPLVEQLKEQGYTAEQIAAAAMELHFGKPQVVEALKELPRGFRTNDHREPRGFEAQESNRIRLNVGREQRVAPNHIVGAITEASGMSGKDIGKIEVYRSYSLVALPSGTAERVLADLKGFTICGVPVEGKLYSDQPPKRGKGGFENSGGQRPRRFGDKPHGKSRDGQSSKHKFGDKDFYRKNKNK